MVYRVIEYPDEIMTANGVPSGSRRGWMDEETLSIGLVGGGQVVATTADYNEMARLVREGDLEAAA